MYDGTDATFRRACTLADVKPTRRQFARWNQRRGRAYAQRHAAAWNGGKAVEADKRA